MINMTDVVMPIIHHLLTYHFWGGISSPVIKRSFVAATKAPKMRLESHQPHQPHQPHSRPSQNLVLKMRSSPQGITCNPGEMENYGESAGSPRKNWIEKVEISAFFLGEDVAGNYGIMFLAQHIRRISWKNMRKTLGILAVFKHH